MDSILRKNGARLCVVIAGSILFLTSSSADAGVDTHVERVCIGTAVDDCVAARPAAEFCAAEIAAEKSVGSDDPGAITVALEALVAAAPDEIRASVEALVANLETGGADLDADGGLGAPHFTHGMFQEFNVH
jgi:hypothetical protein